jgi:hypothetical protein
VSRQLAGRRTEEGLAAHRALGLNVSAICDEALESFCLCFHQRQVKWSKALRAGRGWQLEDRQGGAVAARAGALAARGATWCDGCVSVDGWCWGDKEATEMRPWADGCSTEIRRGPGPATKAGKCSTMG